MCVRACVIFFLVCVDFVFRKRDANASMNFVLRLWLQSKSTIGSNDARADANGNVNASINADNDIHTAIVYMSARRDVGSESDSGRGRGSQLNGV